MLPALPNKNEERKAQPLRVNEQRFVVAASVKRYKIHANLSCDVYPLLVY